MSGSPVRISTSSLWPFNSQNGAHGQNTSGRDSRYSTSPIREIKMYMRRRLSLSIPQPGALSPPSALVLTTWQNSSVSKLLPSLFRIRSLRHTSFLFMPPDRSKTAPPSFARSSGWIIPKNPSFAWLFISSNAAYPNIWMTLSSADKSFMSSAPSHMKKPLLVLARSLSL